jgi:hypothetical protein
MSKSIKPDSKGRITLGSLAEGVSSFKVMVDQFQRIILEPMVEIPASEKWIYNNKEALSSVKQGLQDAKDGNVVPIESVLDISDED